MTQFLRVQASDSEEVVTPLMLDGTYLSRNFATLGPLTSQPPCNNLGNGKDRRLWLTAPKGQILQRQVRSSMMVSTTLGLQPGSLSLSLNICMEPGWRAREFLTPQTLIFPLIQTLSISLMEMSPWDAQRLNEEMERSVCGCPLSSLSLSLVLNPGSLLLIKSLLGQSREKVEHKRKTRKCWEDPDWLKPERDEPFHYWLLKALGFWINLERTLWVIISLMDSCCGPAPEGHVFIYS